MLDGGEYVYKRVFHIFLNLVQSQEQGTDRPKMDQFCTTELWVHITTTDNQAYLTSTDAKTPHQELPHVAA